MDAIGHWNHWVVVVLMMTGFYVIMAKNNLVKKILGLNVFQASVILLYVTMGKVQGGTAAIYLDPIAHEAEPHEEPEDGHDDEPHEPHPEAPAVGAQPYVVDGVIYSNPLPHVLMLTAIVVGVATTAVGLALTVRIQEAYGTIEEDEILALEEGRG